MTGLTCASYNASAGRFGRQQVCNPVSGALVQDIVWAETHVQVWELVAQELQCNMPNPVTDLWLSQLRKERLLHDGMDMSHPQLETIDAP